MLCENSTRAFASKRLDVRIPHRRCSLASNKCEVTDVWTAEIAAVGVGGTYPIRSLAAHDSVFLIFTPPAMEWGSSTKSALISPLVTPSLTPSSAVHILADHIVNDTQDVLLFQKWGYGQSIILDAMILAAETVDGMDHVMNEWVNPVLDRYLTAAESTSGAAYNLTHGLGITPEFIGNAVGDKIGLYPHAYLHRYLHYRAPSRYLPPPGYDGAKDLEVAKRTVDEYILEWPLRWTDGTITRDYPGQGHHWGPSPETGDHQFVWGDDSYMGLTLPARMVLAGLDDAKGTYAQFVATQHGLFAKHLAPTVAEGEPGIFWHGRDAKSGAPSCCRWGRANGWTMMTHVETLTALDASTAPFAAAALKTAQAML